MLITNSLTKCGSENAALFAPAMFNSEGLDLQSTCRAPGVCTGRVQTVGLEQTQDTGCSGAGNSKLEVCSPSQSVRYLCPGAAGLGLRTLSSGRSLGRWLGDVVNKNSHRPQILCRVTSWTYKQLRWYNRGTVNSTRRQRECIQVAEEGEGYRNIIKQLYHHWKCLYKRRMGRSTFVYLLKD